MDAPISTFTVHRSNVVAEAMHRRLNAEPGVESYGWATSAADALYERRRAAGVWIVDERLPHSGAAVLCDRLHRRDTMGEVLALVSLDDTCDVEPVLSMVERGAAAVVDVNCSWPILVKGVRAVAAGDVWLPRRIESGLLKSMLQTRATDDTVIRSLLRLTDRERDVLLLLCRGMSRTEVAEALHISAHTARTHVQRVIEKLGVHSQREVLALGLKHRLAERFDPPD